MYHWNLYCAPKGRATWHRVKEWRLSAGRSQRTKNYTLLLCNRGPAITIYYFELLKAYLTAWPHSVSCAAPLGLERSSSCLWSPPHFPTLHPGKHTGNRQSEHCIQTGTQPVPLRRGFTETRLLEIRKPFPVTFLKCTPLQNPLRGLSGKGLFKKKVFTLSLGLEEA